MKTDKRTATATERRRQAFELRKAGFTYQDIGDHVGISKQAAHGLIRRELIRLTREAEKDATEMRALELERLDALTKALWDDAMKGDPGAIDRLLKISERRSRFLGLDSPVRTAIEAPGSGNQILVYLPDNGRGDRIPNNEEE